MPAENRDLINIDECRRSIHGLWRQVLEYFDAFLVGLTATPVKQTFGLFGQNLVSEHTYREFSQPRRQRLPDPHPAREQGSSSTGAKWASMKGLGARQGRRIS